MSYFSFGSCVPEHQKKCLVEWSKEKNCHYARTQYKKMFESKRPPSLSSIQRIVKKFDEFGEESFKCMRISAPQRLERQENVRKIFEENPFIGATAAAKILKLATPTVKEIAEECGINILRRRKLLIAEAEAAKNRDSGLSDSQIASVSVPSTSQSMKDVGNTGSRARIVVPGSSSIATSPNLSETIPAVSTSTVTKKIPKQKVQQSQPLPIGDNPLAGSILQELVPRDWLQESLRKLFPTSQSSTVPSKNDIQNCPNTATVRPTVNFPEDQTKANQKSFSGPSLTHLDFVKLKTSSIRQKFIEKCKAEGKVRNYNPPKKSRINFESLKSELVRNNLEMRGQGIEPEPRVKARIRKPRISRKKAKTTVQESAEHVLNSIRSTDENEIDVVNLVGNEGEVSNSEIGFEEAEESEIINLRDEEEVVVADEDSIVVRGVQFQVISNPEETTENEVQSRRELKQKQALRSEALPLQNRAKLRGFQFPTTSRTGRTNQQIVRNLSTDNELLDV